MNTGPPGFIAADQQGQRGVAPPVMVISQQQAAGAGNHYSTGSHVGPVIGVLAVIAVLGILAGFFGRLCSGRTVLGYGSKFDIESWVETKCSSCLDGHVAPPRHPLPPMHTHMAMESLSTAAAAAGWRPPENAFMRQHSQSSERNPHPPCQQEQEQEQEHTRVHLRPENVSMRQHSQSSERHPRQQEQQDTGVHQKAENISMPQHSESDRQSHGLHEEVLLHPLPTRRIPMANVSDSAAVGRPEPEITSARVQADQIHQPVDGGLEDDDDMSDLSGHDDEHHHHHGEEEEEEQQHHYRHRQH